MSILETTYDAAVRLARVASPLVSRGSSKLARGIRGRSGAISRLEAWARSDRDVGRPLVWAHAPSVGEGLQARAVLEALFGLRPGAQAAYTFFSPSATGLAERMPVQVASYLPWDVRSELEDLVGLLRPDVLAFTKTEVWPGLTEAAVRRGIPVVLTAATLSADAGRLRPLARRLLRPVFASLDRVLAIAEPDAERFELLGVAPERIDVTGDPGIDSAWERARQADPDAAWLRPFRNAGGPILVAGSTWPPDEAVLVGALTALRGRFPDLRVVIAPHEPTDAHLRPLEASLEAGGYRSERLGSVEERGELGAANAVVVDRVGVLAHLYTIGTLAYVGGGFHDQGLHSVLEPAAAGIPTCFGPRYESSRAAVDLVRMDGGSPVADAAGLTDLLARWLEEPVSAEETGRRGSEYIESHRGAAERTANALAAYMPAADG